VSSIKYEKATWQNFWAFGIERLQMLKNV